MAKARNSTDYKGGRGIDKADGENWNPAQGSAVNNETWPLNSDHTERAPYSRLDRSAQSLGDQFAEYGKDQFGPGMVTRPEDFQYGGGTGQLVGGNGGGTRDIFDDVITNSLMGDVCFSGDYHGEDGGKPGAIRAGVNRSQSDGKANGGCSTNSRHGR